MNAPHLTYILYLVWLYYSSHCLLNWTQCKCNCPQKLLKSSEVLDFDCYLWYRPQCYVQQLFPGITNWLGNYYWFMQLNKYVYYCYWISNIWSTTSWDSTYVFHPNNLVRSWIGVDWTFEINIIPFFDIRSV